MKRNHLFSVGRYEWHWKAVALSVTCTFMTGALFLSPARAAEPEAQLCADGTSISQQSFQNLLSDFFISDKKVRKTMLTSLSQNNNPCRVALEQRLDELLQKPADFVTNTGRNAALTLGLTLEIPTALRIIEAELSQGDSTEWLETLRRWDAGAYTSILRKWLINDAQQRRVAMGLAQLDAQHYGLRQIEELKYDDKASKRTSLVLQLYLRDAAQHALTADEFAALNVHYASLRPGVRKLYKDSFARLVQNAQTGWVQSFRSERSWTQFQLLELMEAAGGAEVVRELLWLSEHHIDKRMKLRAQAVLNHLTSSR